MTPQLPAVGSGGGGLGWAHAALTINEEALSL
jgi:hypothetical protein